MAPCEGALQGVARQCFERGPFFGTAKQSQLQRGIARVVEAVGDEYQVGVEGDALGAKEFDLLDRVVARDAEIDDLKGKVMDAATLDAAVQKRADLIDAAKKIAPKIETKGIADAEIRKAAVVAVRGADAVADKSAAYIDAAFDLLVDNAKEQKQPNPLSGMVASAQSTNDGDPEALRAAAHKSYLDGLNGVQAQKGA